MKCEDCNHKNVCKFKDDFAKLVLSELFKATNKIFDSPNGVFKLVVECQYFDPTTSKKIKSIEF